MDIKSTQNESPEKTNPLRGLSGAEIEDALKDLKNPSNIDQKPRSKTSLRMRYEAEAEIIRKKIGHLEEVRKSLGLSRRKMCQLLMVDPSAWTRWTKGGERVPPHIYRSLQWYLALIDRKPEWHPQNAYLGAFKTSEEQIERLERKISQKIKKSTLESPDFEPSDVSASIDQLKTLTQQLSGQMKSNIQSIEGWKIMLILNLAATTWLIINQVF